MEITQPNLSAPDFDMCLGNRDPSSIKQFEAGRAARAAGETFGVESEIGSAIFTDVDLVLVECRNPDITTCSIRLNPNVRPRPPAPPKLPPLS